MWLQLKIETKMSKGKYASKIKTVSIYVGKVKYCFLFLNWIYHTDEEYFLLKILENSHKCALFGLFITNINLLLQLIFLSLSVFGFSLNKIPFKWYKVPTMLLEKVYIHTEIIFVHCYKILLLSLVLFLCLLKIVYYCLKV